MIRTPEKIKFEIDVRNVEGKITDVIAIKNVEYQVLRTALLNVLKRLNEEEIQDRFK